MKIIKTKRLTGILGCLLALVLTLSLTTPALAVPQPPHQFWGQVTINELQAGEGITVLAKIGEAEYSTKVDADGNYGYDPLFRVPADDPDTTDIEGASQGDLIDFYVAEVLVDTYAFGIGGYTELNLTVGEAPVDTTPPTVVSTLPLADATSIAIDVVVSATFSEDIQAGTNFGGIAISEATGVSASIDGATLTIAHDAFAYETSYTVTIPAGSVKDSADNLLAEAKVWSFTVVTEEEAEFDPYIYDTNEDGEFSKAETLAAVNDYLADNITKNQALEVVKLYFS